MYRKDILTYSLSTLFVFAAALLHLLDYLELLPFSVHILIFCLYTFVILLWLRNMENRILRASSIKIFRSISILLICYLAMRTLKYEILIDNPIAVQHIRYIYYFFNLHIVHLVFLTSLLISMPERESINKLWNLLWIPTELLVLLVLTNDYHGWAFSLARPNNVHQYGPIFYLILMYVGLLAAATLTFTLRPSWATKQFRPILLPVCILAIWILYTFLYIFDWQPFFYVKVLFKSTEFNILAVILFIESLVFTRLIPSNRGYEGFLKLSALNIGILNADGQMIYQPKEGPRVDTKTIQKSQVAPIPIDQNTILESAPIQGGQSFWFVDLRNFNALKAKLIALHDDMISENDLLMADNKLKEKMAKLAEQEEIRSSINSKLEPQFSRLQKIVTNLPDDEGAFENTLKDACVYNVYIKRYANLFLLSKNKDTIALSEVALAFAESLDYLNIRGVKGKLNWPLKDPCDAHLCLQIYEVFQTIIELHLPFMKALSVDIKKKESAFVLNIYIASRRLLSLGKSLEYLQADTRLHIIECLGDSNPHWTVTFEGSVQ